MSLARRHRDLFHVRRQFCLAGQQTTDDFLEGALLHDVHATPRPVEAACPRSHRLTDLNSLPNLCERRVIESFLAHCSQHVEDAGRTPVSCTAASLSDLAGIGGMLCHFLPSRLPPRSLHRNLRPELPRVSITTLGSVQVSTPSLPASRSDATFTICASPSASLRSFGSLEADGSNKTIAPWFRA